MQPPQNKISKETLFEMAIGGLWMMKEEILHGSDYAERNLANYKCDQFIVDTSIVSDTGLFETGIKDIRYYTDWIIVCEYLDEEEAREGHTAWVEALGNDYPPVMIRDINSEEEFTRERINNG